MGARCRVCIFIATQVNAVWDEISPEEQSAIGARMKGVLEVDKKIVHTLSLVKAGGNKVAHPDQRVPVTMLVQLCASGDQKLYQAVQGCIKIIKKLKLSVSVE